MRKRINDATVKMLAYNRSIPGPTLKVAQGSEVTVHFTNQTDLETTVHWHGLRLENRFDGVPQGAHQGMMAPVLVGGSFTYLWNITWADITLSPSSGKTRWRR